MYFIILQDSRSLRKHSFIFLLLLFQIYCRNLTEELRKVARNTLVVLLKPIVSSYLNQKKFHQICLEEMPWRSQMNIYLATAHYNLFKKKLEEQYNIGIYGSRHQDRYIFMTYLFAINVDYCTIAINTNRFE